LEDSTLQKCFLVDGYNNLKIEHNFPLNTIPNQISQTVSWENR